MDLSSLNDLPENWFISYEIIPTLQEMASFKVALTLLNDILHQPKCNDELNSNEEMLTIVLFSEVMNSETEQLLKLMSIPQRIKNLINDKCEAINSMILNWENDILELRDFRCLKRSHLECIVWRLNKEIDYERTARKLMLHSDITEVEKFKMMCEFCWENDINNVVPGIELQQFFKTIVMDGRGAYTRNQLAYYWVCKLNNELPSVLVDDEGESLEIYLLQRVLFSSAFEYFWHFLNECDQITAAILFLRHGQCINNKHKMVFAKLDEFQRRKVIAAIPFVIVMNLIENSDFEAARLLWNRMKTSISEELFSTSIYDILIERGNEESFLFMIELWNSASEDQRNHFIYIRRDLVVDLFLSSHLEREMYHDYRLSFLFTILSNSSSEYRKNIILDHGDILIFEYQNSTMVNEIVEFCLPNRDEIAEFKERLCGSQKLRRYYVDRVENGQFEKLIENLESYMRYDYESSLKYGMRQVLHEFHGYADDDIFVFRTWSDVRKLLEMVYGADLSSIAKIKNKLIFSNFCHEKYLNPANLANLRDYKNAIQDLIDDMTVVDEDPSKK